MRILCQLNNQAVALMAMGEVKIASQAFQTAFDQFLSNKSQSGEDDHDDLLNEQQDSEQDPEPRSSYRIGSIQDHANISRIAHAFSPSNPFEICNRSFTLPENAEREMDESKICLALLYNYALCLHLRGFLETKHKWLRRSLHIYRLAACIAYDENHAPRQPDEGLRCLYMALSMNQGHLSAHFANWKEALNCKELLTLHLQDQFSDTATSFADWLFFFAAIVQLNECGLQRVAASA